MDVGSTPSPREGKDYAGPKARSDTVEHNTLGGGGGAEVLDARLWRARELVPENRAGSGPFPVDLAVRSPFFRSFSFSLFEGSAVTS